MPLELTAYLIKSVEMQASDLLISVGAPPRVKVEEAMKSVGDPLTAEQVNTLIYSVLDDEQIKTFERDWELNTSLHSKHIGRFRINVFRQRGEPALVARYIRNKIPSIAELNLPQQLQEIALEPRGLVLVVGSTGSGKSTTLASMIDYRNRHQAGHILCIEDPVEFVHNHNQSTVNQREVGFDTKSYAVALKNALREAPDMIVIGEIRDVDTMKQAIAYAETGHLCLSTLHANNAYQALDRIINFFPESAHRQVLQDLSLHLRAIISQRLAIGPNGNRIPVVERMNNTPYIADLIHKGKVEKIREAMNQDKGRVNKTFDNALFDLWAEGKLSQDEALKHADSVNNLSLRIRLEKSGDKTNQPSESRVAFDKQADFSKYKSFRLRPLKVSKRRREDIIDVLNYAMINVLQDKGLVLNSRHPDLELQYAFGVESVRGLSIEPIENPADLLSEDHADMQLKGKLLISVIDTETEKPVWQLKVERCLDGPLATQDQIDAEFTRLFEAFPPPGQCLAM